MDGYEVVLNYFKYDYKLESIYVDIDAMIRKNEDSNLIDLLITDQFNVELNNAFKNGNFVFENNLVQYAPYLENEYTINSSVSLEGLNENNFTRSTNYKIQLTTKWYWFGTYKIALNDALTVKLIDMLRFGATAASLISLLTLIMPLVGKIFTKIFSLIAGYLRLLGNLFTQYNKGNGVYFWATTLIVWYVKSL